MGSARCLLAVALSVCAACAASSPATAPPPQPVSVPVATDPSPLPIATMSSCTEPTLSPSPDRDRGIAAFLEGRFDEAVRVLSSASAKDPRDRATEAFRAAATAKVASARSLAGAAVLALPRVPLEPIRLARVELRSVSSPAPTVQLTQASEAKNQITDTADWVRKNQLPETTGFPFERLPAIVPNPLGKERLRRVFAHADHFAAIYIVSIVIAAEGKQPLAFDTSELMARAQAMTHAPRQFEVTFAQLVGKTLLVELAFNGYAKEVGNKNAYLATFDAMTGALQWVSDPLVANAGEAVVAGGAVIAGYGFTAEPDFLFVLDLAHGTTRQKIPLKSSPEMIRAKGDQVFVRAYDVDYVFRSATGLPPPPPAALAPAEGGGGAELEPEARCWTRRAVAGIALRDANTVHDAVTHLRPIVRDRSLIELLEKEETRLGSKDQLDLTTAPIVFVPEPPWHAQPRGAPPASPAPPRLVKLSSRAAAPTRNMDRAFDPNEPWFLAPVDRGVLPRGAPKDIPAAFGQELLSALLPDDLRRAGRSTLIYGGRYVILMQDKAAQQVFDLDAFRHPPKATPQWREFSTQGATFAQERDGVLYVCNGGGSYAKEVYGLKAFMSALEIPSGKLLWRSPPLTCGSHFVIKDDVIVTGYGFTAEPDFVSLVRRSDGRVVQKVPVDSAPDDFKLSGNRIHVETYGHVIDFELR